MQWVSVTEPWWDPSGLDLLCAAQILKASLLLPRQRGWSAGSQIAAQFLYREGTLGASLGDVGREVRAAGPIADTSSRALEGKLGRGGSCWHLRACLCKRGARQVGRKCWAPSLTCFPRVSSILNEAIFRLTATECLHPNDQTPAPPPLSFLLLKNKSAPSSYVEYYRNVKQVQ